MRVLLSRRQVLGAVLLGTGAVGLPSPAWAADEYDTLRSRWQNQILGTGFDPSAAPYSGKLADLGATASAHWSALAPAAGYLWPDRVYSAAQPDAYTRSVGMGDSFGRLKAMATAYAQPGTGLTGNASLRADILAGLDQLYAEVYAEGKPTFGNWWYWRIGAPQSLLDTSVLLYSDLSAAQLSAYLRAVDYYVPDSYRSTQTGANLVDVCRVLALRGVVGKTSSKLVSARDGLSPVFPYVTSGDGFYADGSFIQHSTIPNTGSYGWGVIDGIGRLMSLLAGSSWQVTDPNRQIMFDAVEKAYAPFLYNGLIISSVLGRSISRGITASDPLQIQVDDHLNGHGIIASILRLSEAGSAAEAARWRGLVKGWLQRDYYSPVASDPHLAIAGQALCLNALNDSTVAAIAEPVSHRLFHNMDRAVHRRPGWAWSVSMCSSRIAYYESLNGENLHGWHTGAGMTYWWGSTFGNGQYSDAFWPTVDPYRLPGITVSRKTLANGQGSALLPAPQWAGGCTDGEYATLGQNHTGLASTLSARKSWFCLDDTVVCMGTVSGNDGTVVETIVDNRNLGPTGNHSFTVNGVAKTTTLGWAETITGASWATLQTFGSYVFPNGATVKALREARTGAWRDINTTGATTPITRRYLTLWFDHGTNPANSSYLYLLMPGADSNAAAARAADTGWLTVLANNISQHAISVPSRGFTGINFWQAGTCGQVAVDQPVSVLIRQSGSTATICVSDPKRAVSTVSLTWNRPVSAVTSKDASVTVTGTGTALSLQINVSGKAGATQRATVTLA